ncbi:MAG: glycosyltransferase family 39 protein [Planctomycetota bacterium]|nr:glycosyltransferase family 39 protein [Planctomycetota bacterium]
MTEEESRETPKNEATTPPTEAAAPSSSATREPRGPSAWTIVLVLAVYGILAFWSGRGRQFWGDEAENALTVQQSTRATPTPLDWLVPTTDGAPRLERPPLFTWLGGLADFLTGFQLAPEIVYRLPAVLLALLSLWLTWRLGAGLFDRRIGFLGATIQGTTCFFFLQSSWVGPQFSFVVFCQLALTGLTLGARDNSRWWKAAGWLGLAGASLCGSAIAAVALVFVPPAFHHFLTGGLASLRTNLRRMRGGLIWLLFPVVAAPWYIYASVTQSDAFVEQLVMGSHLDQFLRDDYPSGSLFVYVVVLLVGFLPWSIFIPLAILHGKDRTSRDGQGLCTYWFIVALIGMSLLPAKHGTYTLFLWTPLALLIPAAFYETAEKFSVWEEILSSLVARLLPLLLKGALVFVVVLLGLWLLWLSGVYEESTLTAQLAEKEAVLLFLGLAAVGAIGAFLSSSRVKKLLAAGETAGAAFETARATLIFLFFAGFLLPLLDSKRSAQPFVDEVQRRIGDRPLASYGRRRPGELSYYLEREFVHLEELHPLQDESTAKSRLLGFLEQAGTVYLITSEEDCAALRFQFPEVKSLLQDEPLLSGYLGGRGRYVVVSNKKN